MNNPIYYKDLVTPDDSITKLIKQLEELIGVYDTTKAKIQQSAQQTASAMQSLSGATEEQRKAIQQTAVTVEEMVARYKDADSAEREAIRRKQELNQARKEANNIEKYAAQMRNSEEGSYKRLSAMYNLAKIRLNEMSEAERKGTEAGRRLEAHANALMEKMNALQKATGKYTLQVGNYEIAASSLRQELMDLTMQLAQMRLAGKQNSAEYVELSKKAGILKDAFADAQREIKNVASDTAQLDSIAKGASAIQGGMMTLTSSLNLMGASSESATKAQRALGYTIGIVSGAMAVQNALQKQSSLMIGIRTIQTKAATKAEQLNTTATYAGIVAQKIFNAVAKANPYVLLATALITVVGALTAFAIGANRASKAMEEQMQIMKEYLDYLESFSEIALRFSDERIAKIQDEIEVAKSRNASPKEIYALEDKLYKERLSRWEGEKQIYAQQLSELDKNQAKVRELIELLGQINEAKKKGYGRVPIRLDGQLQWRDTKKALEDVQKQLDAYGASVKVALQVQEEGRELEKNREIELNKRKQQAIQNAKAVRKAEIDAVRAAEDAQLALLDNAYRKEYTAAKLASERKVEDLKLRLKEETNLTPKARKAIAAEIKAIEDKLDKDLLQIKEKYYTLDLAARRSTEDMEIELMEEGAEKRKRQLEIEYTRQINDLQRSLETTTNLTETQYAEMYNQILLLGKKYKKEREKLDAEIALESLDKEMETLGLRLDATKENTNEYLSLLIERLQKEREIALAENKLLTEDKRQDEALINKKYDALILKTNNEFQKKVAMDTLNKQQELNAAEFSQLDRNERQKTKFALEEQARRIESILKNDKTLTAEEKKIYEEQLKDIQRQIKRLPYSNLYEVLGLNLDSEQQDALNEAFSQIKSGLDSVIDSWLSAADAAVNSADKQVEAAQKVLDAEIEARENGYANSVTQAQKELDLARKTQEKALKEKQKAQRAQQLLDTATQASSLITATANIWAAFSQMGPYGYALALAAIAGMWISFGAAKIKAWQVAGSGGKEEYGEGTVELLEGGSHASGNDIDLGRKRDGTRRRAEGGEFFAVINKRNSARYKDIIPDVIKSFNNGTFSDRYTKANSQMSGLALSMVNTDLSALEKDVRKIREQGDEVRIVDGNGNMIVKYKNLTRKIKS